MRAEVASNDQHERGSFDLSLVLIDGVKIVLRQASNASSLEEDRAKLADFFREHGLSNGLPG